MILRLRNLIQNQVNTDYLWQLAFWSYLHNFERGRQYCKVSRDGLTMTTEQWDAAFTSDLQGKGKEEKY